MNPAASLILLPASMLYRAVARARLAAYRRGVFRFSKLPAPVISVGNITTGGTGKTPLVEWVSRTIASVSREESREGKKVCVLTRGYGRSNPKTQVVVSNGTELLATELEGGDEPFLLATNLLGIAAVISNPNRVAAGNWAIENLQSEVFVLDDGFQHLRLFRNLDIVAIDATNPWGDGRGLLRGTLREPVGGLSRANCVVLTRAEQVNDIRSIKEIVQRSAGKVPVLSSRMLTSGFRKVDGQPMEKTALLSQPIGAFCGVGNPESFFSHLRREGFQLGFTRSFPDHHHYKASELGALVREAKTRGVESLLTTAKDATKLKAFELEIPCCVLEIQISIDEEDQLVDLIRKTIFKSDS